jgi:hypothetical protein
MMDEVWRFDLIAGALLSLIVISLFVHIWWTTR